MPGFIGIDEEGLITCQTHDEWEVIYIDLAPKESGNISSRLLCEKCYKERIEKNEDISMLKKVKGKTNKEQDCIIIKRSDLGIFPLEPNYTADFTSYDLEEIIIDPESRGFSPKSVLYIADLHILVSAIESGGFTIWNLFGGAVRSGIVKESGKVKCMAYIDEGATNKFLVAGIEKQVKIYHFGAFKTVVHKALNTSSQVVDIAYSRITGCFYVLTQANQIYVFRGSNGTFENLIDLTKLEIKAGVAAIYLLSSDTKLILEHAEGITVMNLKDQSLLHYNAKHTSFGLAYLPKKNEIMFREANGEHFVLDSESLEVKRTFKTDARFESTEISHFCANEDNSQVLANTFEESLFVYKDDQVCPIDLKGYLGCSGPVEYVQASRKMIVGDYFSGVIYIFRINSIGHKPDSQATNPFLPQFDKQSFKKSDTIELEDEGDLPKKPRLSDLKAMQDEELAEEIQGRRIVKTKQTTIINVQNGITTNTSSLFAKTIDLQPAKPSLLSTTNTSGTSLLSNISTVSLFSKEYVTQNQQPPTGLFSGGASGGLFSSVNTTSGGLFGTIGGTSGSIFSGGSAQPNLFSSLISSGNQPGSLFKPSGGLFSGLLGTNNTGGLFSNKPGGLFGNNNQSVGLLGSKPSGGLFSGGLFSNGNTGGGGLFTSLGSSGGSLFKKPSPTPLFLGRRKASTIPKNIVQKKAPKKKTTKASKSRSKEARGSKSKSRSRSNPKSQSGAKSKSKPKSKTSSKTTTKAETKSKSKTKAQAAATKSKSKSKSPSRSKSKSKTKAEEKKTTRKSRSRESSSTKKSTKRDLSTGKSLTARQGFRIILEKKILPKNAMVFNTEEDEIKEAKRQKLKIQVQESTKRRKEQAKEDSAVIISSLDK